MNSQRSLGYVRRLLASATLLAMAATAGAQEVRPVQADRSFEGKTPVKHVLRAARAGEVAPLLIAVPKLSGGSELIAEVVLGERTLVRETIAVEGDVPERSAVRLVGTQATELEKLRKIAALRGNELAVRISAGDRVVAQGLFRDLDAASGKLVEVANIVGATRVIDVELGLKRNSNVATNGMEPNQECEAQCLNEYQFCSEWTCTYCPIEEETGSQSACEQQYNGCVANCPQVCVDPKDVDEFVRTVYLGSDYYGTPCLRDPRDNQAYNWDVWRDFFREETVRRTEYCNGTYSEQVLSYYNWERWCYDRLPGWCLAPSGTAPGSLICG